MSKVKIKYLTLIIILFSSLELYSFEYRASDIRSNLPSCKNQSYKHNCVGVRIYNNGDKYDGEWVNNKMEGKGIGSYHSGHVFIGFFKNNSVHVGTMDFPKYGKYTGEWKNSKRDGLGIFISKNGQIMEGVWKNDKFQYAKKTKFSKASTNASSSKTDLITENLKSIFNNFSEKDRKTVQKKLASLGLYNSSIDGKFGKGTASALRKFSKNYSPNYDLRNLDQVKSFYKAVSGVKTQAKTVKTQKTIKSKHCDPNYQKTGTRLFGLLHGGDSFYDVICNLETMGVRNIQYKIDTHSKTGRPNLSIMKLTPKYRDFGNLNNRTVALPYYDDLMVSTFRVKLSGINFIGQVWFGYMVNEQPVADFLGLPSMRLKQGRRLTESQGAFFAEYPKEIVIGVKNDEFYKPRFKEKYAVFTNEVYKTLKERGFPESKIERTKNGINFGPHNGMEGFVDKNGANFKIFYNPFADPDPKMINAIKSIRNGLKDIDTKSNTDF